MGDLEILAGNGPTWPSNRAIGEARVGVKGGLGGPQMDRCRPPRSKSARIWTELVNKPANRL